MSLTTGESALICPKCDGDIDLLPSRCYCTNCGEVYPQTMGIPDLRGQDDRSHSSEQLIVQHLLARYHDSTFADLFVERMKIAPTADDLLGHEQGYQLNHLERGQHFFDMFQARLTEYLGHPQAGRALDIGCGVGTSIIAMSTRFDNIVGVDVSMPELILARKNLEEHGLTDVQLVQAQAQQLPFASGSFSYINAVNTLEHVFDLDLVLAEVYRILQPSGTFCADSRNRFDLFLPEPHVKLRWVGLLPRRWAPAYVRWAKNVEYSATRLLSYFELRSQLQRYFGKSWRLVFPLVTAYGQPPQVDRLLALIERIPGLRTMLLWVFPSHLVLAKREH